MVIIIIIISMIITTNNNANDNNNDNRIDGCQVGGMRCPELGGGLEYLDLLRDIWASELTSR